MILAGIDEAGYGPLLGPLVISGCIVRVPDGWDPEGRDLWKHLADCVVKPRKPPSKRRPRRDSRILVGDSKVIYTPSVGPAYLERSALALTGWARQRPVRDVAGLADALLSARCGRAFDEPWQTDDVGRFPLSDDLPVPVAPLAPGSPDIAPLFLGSRVMSAAMLNARYRETPNKATVAWSVVAELLQRVWEIADDERISVVVDRQGGRTHYAAALETTFPGAFVWTLEERGEVSAYRIQHRGRTMEVSFWVGADNRSWPVAVASVISKYWRELAMCRLNDFFARQGCEVRPTAGYYNDGRRWLSETDGVRQKLGIRDVDFVRER